MAANRYDQAAQANFIDTYVPIPFQELFTIGQAAGKRLEDTENYLQSNMNKWWDFKSPSQIDTKQYYDETLGKLKGKLNEYIQDPEKMKSASGQAELRNFINTNIDYNQLSNLEQSREGLLTRQKVNEQLMLSDKYNPLWHNVDFNNYNTSKSGIYNDVSPLAYKSVQQLVQPYVDNLKDSYIGRTKDGLYDMVGVSRDRTKAEVDKNLSSLLTTPEALKHMETMVKSGMTPSQARDTFINQAYTASYEFAHNNINPNEFAAMRYKQALEDASYDRKLRLKEAGSQANPMTYTQQVVASSQTKQDNMVSNMMNVLKPQIYSQYSDLMKRAENDQQRQEVYKWYNNQLTQFKNQNGSNTKLIADQAFSSIKGKQTYSDNKPYTVYSNNDLNKAASKFIANTMTPAGEGTSKAMLSAISGSDVKIAGTAQKAKIVTSGKGFILPKTFALSAWGRRPTQSKLEEVLQSGKLDDNIIVVSGDKHGNFTTYDPTTGGYVNQSKGLYTVYIPYDKLKTVGLDLKRDIQSQGGKYVEQSSLPNISKKYDQDNEDATTTNISYRKPENYVAISMFHDIPNPGSGEWANQVDNFYSKEVENKSHEFGDQSPYIQSQSYDLQ